jgi:hypothetical protein
VLEAADEVSLPGDLYTLATEGKLEALGTILMGTNFGLCGGGPIESLYSFGHDFISNGLFHDDPAFGSLKSSLNTLIPRLEHYPTLSVTSVSVPGVTFSPAPVGIGGRVPLTVNWAASASVGVVYVKAVALSTGLVTQYRQRLQVGTLGKYLLPLKGGTWELCVSETSKFAGYTCGLPFTIHIADATLMNQYLAGSGGTFTFTGSQVGVVVEAANAVGTFDVDRILSITRTFNLYQPRLEWYFRYWAWNLGWGTHQLHLFGRSMAGHVIDIVYIS